MTDASAGPRFCPVCGAPSDGRQFCGNCGGNLAAAPVVTPTATPTARVIEWSGAVILAGGVLAVLGSLLPWITATAAFVGTISRNGFDGGGDGIITVVIGLAIGLVGIAILARSVADRSGKIFALVGAAALGIVAVLDIQSVNNRLASLDGNAVIGSVGTGLILIALSASITLVGAFIPTSAASDPASSTRVTGIVAPARKPNPMVVLIAVLVVVGLGAVTLVLLKTQSERILSTVGASI